MIIIPSYMLDSSQNGARWGIPFLLRALWWLKIGGVAGEKREIFVVASSPELADLSPP
jgi:hypothetical protein